MNDPAPIVINGRAYPLWSQFVHKKADWIGGVLESTEMGSVYRTVITDIILKENGKDSAWFEVGGKDFACGFDVGYGGITNGEPGWITLSGYQHEWRI